MPPADIHSRIPSCSHVTEGAPVHIVGTPTLSGLLADPGQELNWVQLGRGIQAKGIRDLRLLRTMLVVDTHVNFERITGPPGYGAGGVLREAR